MSESQPAEPFASTGSGSASPTRPRVAAVIVLAAGEGKRMRSARSKLLHEAAGQSLLSWAVDAAAGVGAEHLVVVVGHQREQVVEHLAVIAPAARTAVQAEQRGTGHAVAVGLGALPELAGEVVVTYGDVPLLSAETLNALVDQHRDRAAAITVLTAVVADPTGYGRIVRETDGQVAAIVEHRDATPEQRAIPEINSGIYVFDAEVLRTGLAALSSDNDQGELYLTDVLGHARRGGGAVEAMATDDRWEVEGVNDRLQLAAVHAELNARILRRWMRAGVTVLDPATTWVHATVDLAPDVTLLPGTSLEGATSVAAGATIGPETTLVDCEVGATARITRSCASLSVVGAGASVGPYAFLRPGTTLAAGAKVGTFVETKNAGIGAGAKVPHLTYAGDVTIGAGANIGAGTIFANYDGVHKHASSVGAYSFVGSDSVLVAPVRVADGAYVGAGSTVTGDVEAGELAVSRARQRNIAGWVLRKRTGTPTARAAEAALDSRRVAARPVGEEQQQVAAPLHDQQVVVGAEGESS